MEGKERIFHVDDTTGIRVCSYNKRFVEEDVINEIGKVEKIVIGNIIGEPFKTALIYGENKIAAILPNTIYLGDPLLDIVLLDKEPKVEWPCIDIDIDCMINSIYDDAYNVSVDFIYSMDESISLDCRLEQIDITDEDDFSKENLEFIPYCRKILKTVDGEYIENLWRYGGTPKHIVKTKK